MSLACIVNGKFYEHVQDQGLRGNRSILFTRPRVNPVENDVIGVFGDFFLLKEDGLWFVIDSENKLWVRLQGRRTAAARLGEDNYRSEWAEIPYTLPFKKIACHGAFAVAINTRGQLLSYGTLGKKIPEDFNIADVAFRAVGGEAENVTFVDVSVGAGFFLAVDNQGNIWGCGVNMVGQLGTNDYNPVENFELLHEGNFTAVSCGRFHTLCLDADGNVWGCGLNNDGQLGLQIVQNPQSVADNGVGALILISEGFQVKEISAGNANSLLLLNDGRILGCGSNFLGQLGELVNRQYNDHHVIGQFRQVITSEAQIFDQITNFNNNTLLRDTTGQLWASDDRDYIYKKIKIRDEDNMIVFAKGDLPGRNLVNRRRINKSARNYF